VHKRLVTVAALAAGLLAAGSAAAQGNYADKTGRFGIGGDATLAGVGGLSARFQVAKNFGVQAIFGFARVSVGEDASFTATDIALRGDIGLAFTQNTNLSVIFGVDIFRDGASVGGMSDSSTDIALEGGMKVEYFFNDLLSIHGEVGIVVFTGDGTDTVIGGAPQFQFPDTFGRAGFTFWIP
jgi:hypothetical protein